jgi:hypothetical protein
VTQLDRSPLNLDFAAPLVVPAPVFSSISSTFVAGTAIGGAASRVTVFDASGQPMCSAGVSSDGSWSCDPSQSWSGSSQSVTAVAYDPAGQVASVPTAGYLTVPPVTQRHTLPDVTAGDTFTITWPVAADTSPVPSSAYTIDPPAGIAYVSYQPFWPLAGGDPSVVYTFRSVTPGTYSITLSDPVETDIYSVTVVSPPQPPAQSVSTVISSWLGHSGGLVSSVFSVIGLLGLLLMTVMFGSRG